MNRIRLVLALAVAGLVLAACGVTTPPAVQHTLSLTFVGSGSVAVTIGSGTPTSYSANKSLKIDEGTKVTLVATAASGFDFSSWGGACASASGTTCTVTMDANKNVSATFTVAPPNTFALDVTFGSGMGNGTVQSGEGVPNIDCAYDGGTSTASGTCSFNYTSGDSVTLTAADSDANSVFDGWGGDCASATGSTCTLTMDAAKSVTASFVLKQSTTIQVNASTNDAEEFVSGATGSGTYTNPGAVDPNNSFMELTYSDRWQTQQIDGLRFVNVNIPANAKVLSARLVFTALNRTTGAGQLGTGDGNAVSIDIYGQADVNPATFADAQDGSGLEGDISNRPKTSAMATWAIPDNAGGGTWVGDTQYATDDYDSAVGADLGAVVEEIVGMSGWSQSSNAMVFVLQDANPSSSSGYRYAYTWNSDPAKAAQLEITYH